MTKEEYTERFNEIVEEWKNSIDKYSEKHEVVKQLDSSLSQLDKKYLKKIKALQKEYHD